MAAETEPIALKLKPCLWRIIVSDDLLNPKRVRNITVKGSSSLKGAIDSAMHTDSFEDFHKEFPLCAIAKAEFIGLVDNM